MRKHIYKQKLAHKKITKGSAVTVDSDKTSCERSKMILLLSNMGLI